MNNSIQIPKNTETDRTSAPPTLTAQQGTNADLIADIFKLYVPKGSVVADVTYGRGVFWEKINESDYEVLKTDLAPASGGVTKNDFRNLPYEAASVDVLILDPPYMHGGATIKQSINKCYHNANTGHESVVRKYAGGILEAARVLKKGGRIIVKCQDEIESGKQRLTHVEIIEQLKMLGFEILDFFVLMQTTVPAMREQYQLSARKNHSYGIVARFRR